MASRTKFRTGPSQPKRRLKSLMAEKKKLLDPIDVHVGNRVHLRRNMLGISQQRLGEGLGITFQQIQKYEKGRNRISASRLQGIAELLSVPVSYFFEDLPSVDAPEETQLADSVAGFVSSREGIQLNRAFSGIEDYKLRRAIVNFVKAMAGEEN